MLNQANSIKLRRFVCARKALRDRAWSCVELERARLRRNFDPTQRPLVLALNASTEYDRLHTDTRDVGTFHNILYTHHVATSSVDPCSWSLRILGL
jgi:hypothetical protein